MEIFLFLGVAVFGGLVGWVIASWKGNLLLRKADFEKQTLKEKILFLQKFQDQFAEQFKGISSEALKQNHETFLHLATSTFEKYQEKSRFEWEKKEKAVQELMKPVRQSLEKFEEKVQDIEKARVGAYAGLKEQIGSLLETQKQLRNETSNLVKALRTPVVRGRWGEIQLRRVVELAGMIDHCDFYEQESVTTEERRFRPDLLVRLPGKKNIIIDAKAPLEAYLEALEAGDEEVKRQKMKDHARQIRQHMTLLSRKSYWEQFDSTPEFVVLFLPGETFFSSALEHDPALIEMGVEQQVILATPTTLIALLRAVAFGWKQEKLSANAEQISSLGRELYKRICDMGTHWGRLGKSLGAAVEAYNKAVGTLESRVLVSARRFKDLEAGNAEKELEMLEPLEHLPRQIQVVDVLLKEEVTQLSDPLQ